MRRVEFLGWQVAGAEVRATLVEVRILRSMPEEAELWMHGEYPPRP